MECRSISINKPYEGGLNEDAIQASLNRISISDGAGGGGVFAEKWSRYLLENLPHSSITSWNCLDEWLDTICELFFDDCEEVAKKLGPLVLKKFYSEGASATLAVVWHDISRRTCQWISYGDSVVFHYNFKNHILEHSFSRLADFDKPPFLINCKEAIHKEGFKNGEFSLDKYSIVFICSDALSHYLLMLYEVERPELFHEDLSECISMKTRNSFFVRRLMSNRFRGFEQSLLKLISASKNKANYKRYLEALLRRKVIVLDDYSFAYIR